MDGIDSFTSFVNSELPKRIGTEVDPLKVGQDKIAVSTGVGLSVKFVDPLEILPNQGLITAEKLPLQEDGTAILPQPPKGGILLNLAIIHLNDGSVIEVTGVHVRDDVILVIPTEDFATLQDTAVSVTVSFIGDL
ncbi:tail fiber protein [Pseudomonas phage PhiPA3]|uniref:Tail protein n=1 Tax=Pseudomonas phage PhiPA3 TaxID=998086 RepID=F8SK40_BPPA3|nr:tail fiber protein [Pseudomonas phage PhiPA3]AEH03590.1 tail protein [Pseudomonas phage PhiPA3]